MGGAAAPLMAVAGPALMHGMSAAAPSILGSLGVGGGAGALSSLAPMAAGGSVAAAAPGMAALSPLSALPQAGMLSKLMGSPITKGVAESGMEGIQGMLKGLMPGQGQQGAPQAGPPPPARPPSGGNLQPMKVGGPASSPPTSGPGSTSPMGAIPPQLLQFLQQMMQSNQGGQR